MTHKSNLLLNCPKFEFIDTQSNSSFSVYPTESDDTHSYTTPSRSQVDRFPFVSVPESPDPLDLCEIKLELNSLELADIKREEIGIAQAFDVGDHNYAYVSRSEHSYAKTYPKGFEQIEKLIEDQRYVGTDIKLCNERGSLNNNVEAYPCSVENNVNDIEAQHVICKRIGVEKSLNNQIVVVVDDNLSRENIATSVDLSEEMKTYEELINKENVNSNQIVNQFYILNEENESSANEENNVMIDVLIEAEDNDKELQKTNVSCLNVSEVAYLNEPPARRRQSRKIRHNSAKNIEKISKKIPTILKHQSFKCNKITEVSEVSETQTYIFEDQSKEKRLEFPETSKNQLDVSETKSKQRRLEVIEELNIHQLETTLRNAPEEVTLDCDVIKNHLGKYQDQPSESQNQSGVCQDKQKWQMDVDAVLKAMYLRESGVHIVNNDLPLKPLESTAIVDLLNDITDCNEQTNSETNNIVNITFKCNSCKFCTPHEPVLKMHLQMHMKQKLHRCLKCSYKTPHKYKLMLHSQSHRKEIITYACPKCSNTFKTKLELFQHLKSHTKDLPVQTTIPQMFWYECNTCKYRTKNQAIMQKHLETH